MSPSNPEQEDYVRFFQKYGKDLGSIYRLEGKDDPYVFLFEQVIKMLIRPWPFNVSLPALLGKTAHRYHRGDSATLGLLGHPDNRHFMHCDLHDLVMP